MCIRDRNTEAAKFQPCNPGYFWYSNGTWPEGYWSKLTNKWQDKATRPQLNNIFLKGDMSGVVMTYAEAELLLAEAKARWAGDITTGADASMSFDPETIYQAIKKHVPQFEMIYDIDPLKQRIADSWPDSLDDTCAREEWGWKPAYNLESMTVDMLEKLREKLK